MRRLVNGKALLAKLMSEYIKEVYSYNERLPRGIVLKPFHYVKSKGRKYVYVGKYFYKYERVNGKVRWRYLGKEPPEGCPPPPPNPLDGLSARIEGNDLIVSEEIYEKYLKGLEAKLKALR